MTIVTTTEKGQVVIPADIRKRHKIAKGTKPAIYPLFTEPVKEARGAFKGGKSALQALLKDRADEAGR